MSPAAERQPEWRLPGIIFFGLIALLVLWSALRIIWPFISSILVGAMTVTLTLNIYRRLRARFHLRASIAAITMLVAITFLIVIPAFILGLLLIQQADVLIKLLQSGEVRETLARLDLSARLAFLHRWFPNFDPKSVSAERLVLPVVQEIPGWVARNGAPLIGSLAGLVIGFFLFLLTAYFFYVEGEAIVAELSILSPLPSRYDRQFATQFKDVIDATFRGHVVTGLAQGVVTMIGLVIVGIPAAFFWGAVATVMSLLPLVGAAAVWVPAAIYLYFQAAMGHIGFWRPVFLTVWGLGAVSLVDNIVRPLAMRGRSQLPAIPLLISVLGGLEAFGFIGLVIGPLVFSLFMSIIDIYKTSFHAPAAAAANEPAGKIVSTP